MYTLFTPIEGANASEPVDIHKPANTATITPFGSDYRGGVSLAAGWLTGSQGGAEAIVVGQKASPGAVKVYSSGSALQGGPEMYLMSMMAHSHNVDFTEAASFTPFGEGSGVSVATTSTTIGADLLVSGVAADDNAVQVRKFQLVRPSPDAPMLDAKQIGQIVSDRLCSERARRRLSGPVSAETSTLLLCARVLPGREAEFAQWHVRWQSAVLASKGAISVEFWPPAPPDQLETVVVNRFTSVDALQAWRRSEQNQKLVAEAAPLVEAGLVMQLVGQAAVEYSVRHGVTMVMVTEIKPGKEAAYRAWADRIQKLQATFPGYIGSFVQPPQHKERGWTTVLRFDSAANLDRWIKSKERAAMVKESEDLVHGLPRAAGRHIVSRDGSRAIRPRGSRPIGGRRQRSFCSRCFPSSCWSSNTSIRNWRTLNPALRTFIGNVISVALTTWPLMPLAIWMFSAWLFPQNKPRWLVLTSPLFLARRLRGGNRVLLALTRLISLLAQDRTAYRYRRRCGPMRSALRRWIRDVSPVIAWRRHRRSAASFRGNRSRPTE